MSGVHFNYDELLLAFKFSGLKRRDLRDSLLGVIGAISLASCVCMVWTAAAEAQQASPDMLSAAQSPPSTPGTQAAAADQQGTKANSGGLQEIVVTAERRSESLQKAPLSITVVTPTAVKNLDIRNLETVQLISPSMTWSAQDSFTQIFIRGIGSNYANPGLETPVAFYQDDVYLTAGIGNILNLVDTSSTQVLNGPQGTLYGRNASGGVILINTANPTDKEEGSFNVEYGRFNHRQYDLMINEPITDELKVRFAAQTSDTDGYIHNNYDGGEVGAASIYTLRGKIDWTPSPDWDILWETEYGYSHLSNNFEQERAYAPDCLGCQQPGVTPAFGFYNTNQNNTTAAMDTYVFDVLHVTKTFDDFTLKSVTAYRRQGFHAAHSDQDFTTADIFVYDSVATEGWTYSEDLTLTSSFTGPVNFIGGLTYIRDFRDYDAGLDGGTYVGLGKTLADETGLPLAGTIPRAQSNVRTDSGSGFIEATYQVTDDLKLTAGGRYTVDRRQLDTQTNLFGSVIFGNNGIREQQTYYSFTPRLVASYHTGFGDLYVSDTRGFKAGGVNTPAFVADPIIGPEKIHSEEIGLKSKWLDNRLRTNVDVFHYKDIGLQVQVTDIAKGGDFTENAGSSEATGAEFSAQYAVTDGLTLGLGGDYLHARFVTFKDPTLYCPTTTGLVACSYDISGTVLPHSPSFQGYATADYTFPTFLDWTADVNVVAHYTSGFDFQASAGGPLRFDRQVPYWLVNINASVTDPSEKLKVGFYIDNALNTQYADYRSTSGPYGTYDQVALPLTYGLKLEYKFGDWSRSDETTTAAAAPPPPEAAPPQAAVPAPVPEAQRVFQVFFDFDKSDVSQDATRVIQAAADAVKGGRFATIKITGHTDTVGSASYNLKLSQRRANAVKRQLVSDGVAADGIATSGAGKTGLLVPTPDGVREPQNRRAEIQM